MIKEEIDDYNQYRDRAQAAEARVEELQKIAHEAIVNAHIECAKREGHAVLRAAFAEARVAELEKLCADSAHWARQSGSDGMLRRTHWHEHIDKLEAAGRGEPIEPPPGAGEGEMA